ncbi:hypothetical protein D3C81_1354960 [compost metagenome]
MPGVIDHTPLPVGSSSGTLRLSLPATGTSLMPYGSLPVGALTRRLSTASGRVWVSLRNRQATPTLTSPISGSRVTVSSDDCDVELPAPADS